MVLSVFAMTAAFAGSAAAITDTNGDGISTGVNTTGVEATHSLNITYESGDLTNDNITNLTVDYATNADVNGNVSGLSASDVTVNIAGSSVNVNEVTGTDTAEINISQTAVSAGNTIEVQLDGVVNPGDGDVNIPVTLTDSGNNQASIPDLTLQTTAPDVSVSPERGVTTVGSGVDYTVEVLDNTGSPIQGADVSVDDPAATDNLTDDSTGVSNLSTTITTDSTGTATITLYNTSDAGANDDGIGVFDANFTEQLSNDPTPVSITHESTGQDTAYIDGNVGDDQLNAIQNDGDISINVTRDDGVQVISDVNLSEFGSLASSNPYVESAGFESSTQKPGDQRGEYYVEFLASQTYTYTFEANLEGFEAFDGPVEVTPGDQGDRNLRLTRIVSADELTVLADGERSNVIDDIDAGNVPVDDPSSLGSTRADLEETVTLDAFVETADDSDFGTSIGELAPFENETGEVDVTVANVDYAGIDPTDISVTPDPADTDENGLSAVDVAIDFGTAGVAADDVDDTVNVDLEFNASSNTSANDVVTVEFVPDIGDTGTISGEVDVINETLDLGAQSNLEDPRSGIPVWAVQQDRVDTNTVTVNYDDGIDTTQPDMLDGNWNPDDADVQLDEGAQLRVVTYDNGEATIEDPRKDYLTSASNADHEIVQNETSLGVEIHDSTDNTGTVDFHFLENTSYQVQHQVVWTNASTGETQTAWHNVTMNDAGHADASTLFEATENLQYDAIDSEFEDERVIPTDTTNSEGNFELLNLPTNVDGTAQDYTVIAGAGDTAAAQGADNALGFANFRGFDTGVAVTPNADDSAEQHNVDLSVQEFEIERFFSYDLDVTLRNDDGDFLNQDRIPVEEDIEVGVFVNATDQETDEVVDPDSSALQGQTINLSTLDQGTPQTEIDPGFGELLDTELTVEHVVDGQAYANTTFEANDLQTGTVNISASTENERDQMYVTRDDQGTGINDRGDQAQIEVFDTVEITGDVVNEHDNNIPGAEVVLFDLDEVQNPTEIEPDDENATADTIAGSTGSYVFTSIETGNSYGIKAIALDNNGNEVSNTRTLNGGDPVDTALGGEDIVVQGASSDQPLQDASFSVSNLDPETATVEQGDELTVTATVTNDGAISDTQTVELRIGGNAVASEEVTLDSGASTDVSFEDVSTASLDAGDYTHGVYTDDDEAEGTLTVEESQVPATFEVSNVDAPDTATVGDSMTVTAEIENTGDVAGEQPVMYILGSEVINITEPVQLDAGASTTVEFDVDTTDVPAGDYTHGVYTDADEVETSITVEEATTQNPTVVGDDPATDTTGDGVLNDVNGDGSFTATDVQALFANQDSDAVQNNPELFDFNGDGSFTVSDVQALFAQL